MLEYGNFEKWPVSLKPQSVEQNKVNFNHVVEGETSRTISLIRFLFYDNGSCIWRQILFFCIAVFFCIRHYVC